jgi:hypothetical protein
MTRWFAFAGVALAGTLLGLVLRQVSLASEPCCPCTPVAVRPPIAKPPAAESRPASHFVHFALDGLTCKSGEDRCEIKRIEFQYKGEGIIDSHIVKIAALAAKADQGDTAENVKKVLALLERIWSKCEIKVTTSESEKCKEDVKDPPTPVPVGLRHPQR